MKLNIQLLVAAAGAILVTLGAACDTAETNPLRTERTVQEENAPGKVSGIPAFAVIEWSDMSHALMKRATARVVIEASELPNEDDIKQVAQAVQRQQAHLWDQITVFVFLPGMDPEGAAYGIAEFKTGSKTTYQTHDSALILTEWYEHTPEAKRQRREEEEHDRRSSSGEIVTYDMTLTLKSEGSASVSVECLTTLPEGTLVSLVIGREYWMRGADAADDAYAEYYLEEEQAVSAGRVAATISLDDRKWKQTVKDHAAKMRSFTLDMRVSKLSEEVFARALYTSNNRDHPMGTIKILGANGEYVGGPLSRKAGKGRAMSVKESIRMPLKD